MSKTDKTSKFNPNSLGLVENNIFGLPFTLEEAEVVIIPVPWEVTVSYKSGTANGPSSIYEASLQVDLYDPDIKDAWKLGIAMENVSDHWYKKNLILRKKTSQYIRLLEKGLKNTSVKKDSLKTADTICNEINKASEQLNNWVKEKALQYFDNKKLAAVLGGEHSCPLGLMQALAEKYPGYAILQIDAHADLRNAYEGFTYSHASIMFNALKIPQVTKLVQVGIRDYCEEEASLIMKLPDRIKTFTDKEIKKSLFEGNTWKNVCDKIIKELPHNVYISFDIDGLDPSLCPNTGTPVPGGLQFEEANYLLQELVNNQKRIVGFDLCETASNKTSELDANVGARILYKLSNLMGKSNGKI